MNFVDGDTAYVMIHSEVTAEMGEELNTFIYGVTFLDHIKNIIVSINSGGGSILSGYSIYSALENAKKEGINVTTKCDGIAASIASVIWLAGNIKQIVSFGLVMIHNPFGSDDKTLLKIKESLMKILQTSFKMDNLSDLMDQETWYNSDELLQLGILNSDDIIQSDIKLDTALIENKSVTKLYELCNNILKNKNDEMLKNEALPVDEETTKNAEETETTEDPKAEEITLESLNDRVTALETQVASLMEVSDKLIVENKSLKEKKENDEKVEILNKAGIETKDFSKWLNLDIPTIKNLTSTIKNKTVTVTAPKIELKNDFSKGLTKEVFNKMNDSEQLELLKTDKETFFKLYRS